LSSSLDVNQPVNQDETELRKPLNTHDTNTHTYTHKETHTHTDTHTCGFC